MNATTSHDFWLPPREATLLPKKIGEKMQVLLLIFLSIIALISLIYSFSTKSMFAFVIAGGLLFAMGGLLLNEGIEKETSAVLSYTPSGDVNAIQYTYSNVKDSGTFALGWVYTGTGIVLLGLIFIYGFSTLKI